MRRWKCPAVDNRKLIKMRLKYVKEPEVSPYVLLSIYCYWLQSQDPNQLIGRNSFYFKLI